MLLEMNTDAGDIYITSLYAVQVIPAYLRKAREKAQKPLKILPQKDEPWSYSHFSFQL